MRPEVVFACLTLCLLEAESSNKRRHLPAAPFGDTFRLGSKFRPSSATVEKVASNHWTSRGLPSSVDQSAPFFRTQPVAARSISTGQFPYHFGQKHSSRSDLLKTLLRKETGKYRNEQMTSLLTKRRLTSRTEKRRSRYRCDFTRISLQMILEYFRSRRICGYRVNRVRFGLGGK